MIPLGTPKSCYFKYLQAGSAPCKSGVVRGDACRWRLGIEETLLSPGGPETLTCRMQPVFSTVRRGALCARRKMPKDFHAIQAHQVCRQPLQTLFLQSASSQEKVAQWFRYLGANALSLLAGF